jgi:hypothetical protein
MIKLFANSGGQTTVGDKTLNLASGTPQLPGWKGRRGESGGPGSKQNFKRVGSVRTKEANVRERIQFSGRVI